MREEFIETEPINAYSTLKRMKDWMDGWMDLPQMKAAPLQLLHCVSFLLRHAAVDALSPTA